MSKTIIQFDLIKYDDNRYCVDLNSFTMYGSMGISYLTDLFEKVNNWGSEVWKDLKSQDENCREVIMNVFIDSDDFHSWIDFEVLTDFPNDICPKLKDKIEQLEKALDWAKAGFISLRDMHKKDNCVFCHNIAQDNINEIDKAIAKINK